MSVGADKVARVENPARTAFCISSRLQRLREGGAQPPTVACLAKLSGTALPLSTRRK